MARLIKWRKASVPVAGSASACYRVALFGFSDFERNALAFCLKHAARREPGYVQAERLADSDFVVADASREVLATSVTRSIRMHETLFVGDHAPPGARFHVERPIDPEAILNALDDMASQRDALPDSKSGSPNEDPDIVPPMTANEIDFPTLSEFDIVQTIPAAFHHQPVLINLLDLEPIAQPCQRGIPEADLAPEAVQTPEHAATSSAMPTAAPALVLNFEPMLRFADLTSPGSASPSPVVAMSPPELRIATSDGASPQGLASDAGASTAKGAPTAADAEDPASAGTMTPTAAPAAPPSAPKQHAMTTAERAEAKAAARRRSRLARLAQAGLARAESLRDVLLLGPPRANAEIAARLEAFGFVVRPATYSADALTMIAEMPLAAAFLDVAAGSEEDMDGLELCMEIKQQRAVLAGAVPPVFLLANRDSAAGRVRAKLAGCDALLIRPVGRGDVARALEACDVRLPADERRLERC